MEAGAGAGAGASGWSCPGPGQSAPPSPHQCLSFLFSISPPPRPPRPLPLPLLPTLTSEVFLLPPSCPQPGPGLHLSRLGLPHTGRILLGSPCPEPSQSRLSSLILLPALGSLQILHPLAPLKLLSAGRGWGARSLGRDGGEGRGSGPRDPRQPSPAPLPTFPLGALPHPFSLFTGSHPLPFLSILPPCPLWAKETHTLSACARERSLEQRLQRRMGRAGRGPQRPSLRGSLGRGVAVPGRVSQVLPPE